ncbi:MAG: ATP-binding protein [Chloroflexota bacterium]
MPDPYDLIEQLANAAHRIAVSTDTTAVLQATFDAITNYAPQIDCIVAAGAESAKSDTTDADHVIHWTVSAVWDRQTEPALASGSAFDLLQGSLLDSLARGEPLVITALAETTNDDPKIDEDTRRRLAEKGLVSLVVVALNVHDQWLGLLLIGCRQPHSFEASEIRLYQLLADQAALGLVRHRLAQNAAAVIKAAADMFHDVGDCMITTDLNRIITSFNAAAEIRYDVTATQMIGKPISVLIPPHCRAENELWSQLAVQQNRALRGETERIDKHRQIFPVYMVVWPLHNGTGRPVGVAEFTIDNSAHLHIQTVLQDERDLYEAILESSPEAIVMFNMTQQVTAANLQFESFFQLSRYKLVQHTLDELIQQIRQREDLPADLANILLTFVGDMYQSAAGDFEMLTNVRRVLVWYSTPVYANSGVQVGRLFAFRDATQERAVDHMKTDFVSLVSHELNTPLTSIRGFTDLILDGDAGGISGTVREYLKVIKFNTDRLIALINDVLDITRIEAGRLVLHRDLYEVQSLIDKALLSVLAVTSTHQQQLQVTVAPDLPLVWVDQHRMIQVIANLLGNASKYTNSGGSITVEARMVIDSPLPETSTVLLLPAILIGIHDTGIGIAPKDLSLLFTRFYRAEQVTLQQVAGTGLGLAIVKSFVELHGGQVWVQSELGLGSSFYFTIPLVGGGHDLHSGRGG